LKPQYTAQGMPVRFQLVKRKTKTVPEKDVNDFTITVPMTNGT